MKVYDKSGAEITINTDKELGSGGEGIIYELSKKLVAKIYHPHIKPAINQQFLIELSKLSKRFIKPIDLFYNKSKAIVGFSMDYLDMHSLHPFTDLFSKATCNQHNYGDKFKQTVLNSLIDGVEEAHSKNVVIGDLNPYNLLFDDKGQVFFIDTDSYQTSSRSHSGVMLPDIRDWLNHKIDKYSDFFSLSILAFNASTFVHPYKGVHKTYKSIEERVLRHLSLLSGNKDIIIPSFYQPIVASNMSNQYYEIFQDDRRFLISVDNFQTVKKSIPKVVATITTNQLSIKQIAENVKYFQVYDKYLVIDGKDSYDVGVHSTFTKLNAPVYIPLGFRSGLLFIQFQFNDAYTIITKNGWDHYQCFKGNIFVPSLVKCNEVLIQSVSGQKWLLYPTRLGLVTIRTKYDIRDAYKRDNYLCLKIKEGNRMKTYLSFINGMSVELGEELDDMRNFCVIGNNVFVPEDKKICVYSSLRKIAEIDCDYVTENSVLESCNAGIICQTDDKLMLINKT